MSESSIICINLLYVDDEVNNLNAFKATFRRQFQVYTVENARDALQILKDQEIHIIISDQRMPHTTGVEFFESILTTYPDPIRMLLTGYADINAVVDAINRGRIYKYFSKPWNAEELGNAIREAYQKYLQQKEEKEMNKKLIDVNEKIEFMLRQKLLS
jgi:response regulator RpfG family c-di-GMP phosphodiesterase